MTSKEEAATNELIGRMRKAARAVYLATDSVVADDLSDMLKRASDEIERLRAVVESPTDEDRDAMTDEALWDFAGELLNAWNIEDTNEPSLSEQFRDMFVDRFSRRVSVPPTEDGVTLEPVAFDPPLTPAESTAYWDAITDRTTVPPTEDWEYATVSEVTGAQVINSLHSQYWRELGYSIIRRRPAGPWLPVGDEQ